MRAPPKTTVEPTPPPQPAPVDRRIEYLPLGALQAAKRNPKGHSPDVSTSIARFGYVEPMVRDERTGRLVAGHGRREALLAERKRGAAPPAGVKVGDLFVLGSHRLLCGDSTKAEDVRRVMGAEKATLCWTDPPYGVSYVGGTKAAKTIKNDGAEGLPGLLAAVFLTANSILADGAAIYVAHPPGAGSVVFGNAFLAAGWRLHQTLIWLKDSMVLGHSDYHYRHEPILFGYKPGGGRRGRGGEGWYGDNSQTSVFEIPRPKRSEEHPTMKPVALVEAALKNSSAPGALVFEPFSGSGTTLIACEQLGRRCRAIELDPPYVQVAVERWEKLTGKSAVKEST